MTEPRDPTLDVLLDLDGQILVVDPAGGHWVRFVVTRVPVSSEKPHGLDYSLTLHGPDGERLVALVDDQAYVWKIADGGEQARMQLVSEWFALSPDGSRALIRDDELNLIVWDLERNTEVTRLRDAPDSAIIHAAISPDRSLALVAFDEGVPQLYSAVDGSLIRSFEQDKDANVSWSLAFSPDGTLAIAGTSDIDIPAARVWDVASGQIRARLVGHQDVVTAVAFSADGTKAITGSWDRSVKLWDLASQSVERSFEGHTRTVRSVELSPDGRLLLSGGDNRAIILWDVASATELARYAENDGLILNAVARAQPRRACSLGARESLPCQPELRGAGALPAGLCRRGSVGM